MAAGEVEGVPGKQEDGAAKTREAKAIVPARPEAGTRRPGSRGRTGAAALPDPRRARMVRKPLVRPAADEPADREIRLRLAHQAAVVHDPEQEPRQHQPDSRLGVDPRPPAAGAMAAGDLVAQPAGSRTRSTRAGMWSSGTSCSSDPATNNSGWAGGLRFSMSWLSPFPQQHHVPRTAEQGVFNSPDMDPVRPSPCRSAASINAPRRQAGHAIALGQMSSAAEGMIPRPRGASTHKNSAGVCRPGIPKLIGLRHSTCIREPAVKEAVRAAQSVQRGQAGIKRPGLEKKTAAP